MSFQLYAPYQHVVRVVERQRERDVGGDIVIEVIFDPACPWCYVGKRRLEQALAMRPFLPWRIRWWPFLLYPEPMDTGPTRMADLVGIGGPERRVRRAQEALVGAGRGAAIPFALDRIGARANSVHAHRLVRLADEHGCGDEMVEALFCGHFVEGLDIGDLDVLVAIAEQVGLDPEVVGRYLMSSEDIAEVQREHARARRLGINGVPSFVFNGALAISGAQEPQVLARMLDVTATFDAAARTFY
ncbi:MAG: DsbA family oxidoreductase [Rhodospirillales bacterium]|nr:DsbA family oxidoreductase [Rhodospirillales bacterium]